MNKWEIVSQNSSFRQAYEAREKALMDEAAKFAYACNEEKRRHSKRGSARENTND